MIALIILGILAALLGYALCRVAGDSSRQEEYWWMKHPDDDDGISIVVTKQD